MKTKKRINLLKTTSDFADTFAQITWAHVNKDKYPNISEDDLASLSEIFYFHLESNILNSILRHADEDVLRMYESYEAPGGKSGFMSKGNGEDKGAFNNAANDEDEPSFNYEAFDFLVSLMLGDDELQPKVEADIEEFARGFSKVAHEYLS